MLKSSKYQTRLQATILKRTPNGVIRGFACEGSRVGLFSPLRSYSYQAELQPGSQSQGRFQLKSQTGTHLSNSSYMLFHEISPLPLSSSHFQMLPKRQFGQLSFTQTRTLVTIKDSIKEQLTKHKVFPEGMIC